MKSKLLLSCSKPENIVDGSSLKPSSPSQVRDDYLSQERCSVDQDTAVQLGCLDIRRFFRDLPPNALDKKSNIEFVEQVVGWTKFLPRAVVERTKSKTLRKQVQQQFKKCCHMRELECMFKYLDVLKAVARYDQERFVCTLGVSTADILRP